jgi:integrase
LDFNAGFRFGELAGLQVEDLDFENSVIHVGRGVYKKQLIDPKSDAGFRNVPIKPELMAKLKEFVSGRKSD